VLLCLFVAGNLLYAVPFPHKRVADDDRETWRAADLEMWHGWLSGLGLSMPLPRFRDQVIDGSNRLHDLGRTVHAPVRPFFRTMRSTQQWGLFGVVSESPEALVVEVARGDTWEVVERRLDPDHDWLDHTFLYRRVRGTWDTVRSDRDNPLYEAFCRWTARKAFAEWSDIDQVRVYRERFVVNAPWEQIDKPPRRLHERTFQRGQTELWVLR
jgi:hypothetical protein